MKLLIFPLAVLVALSLLSMTGLGDTLDTSFYINSPNNLDGTPRVLYDIGGNAKCYYNGTALAEDGKIVYIEGGDLAGWHNGTWTAYPLYYDMDVQKVVFWGDLSPTGFGARSNGQYFGESFSITGSLGFIALIVVMMGIGTLVGIKFFGSGLSEFSVGLLFTGTALITVWAVFSVLAYDLIFGTNQFVLFMFYFILTVVYTIGIVLTVSGGNGNSD